MVLNGIKWCKYMEYNCINHADIVMSEEEFPCEADL